MRKQVFGVSDQIRSDTNRAVHPQKMARGLKFRIWVEEASLFSHMQKAGFLITRLIIVSEE